MVTQVWMYSRGVSKNDFFYCNCIEMKAIVEEKVSGGIDEEGREVQTLMRRLTSLHCALHLWF